MRIFLRLIAIFITLFTLLLQSCGGEQGAPFQFLLTQKAVIDESGCVLRAAPYQVQVIKANELAFINDDELCVYNTTDGKLLRRFNRYSINGDSIIRNTIGIQQKDSIIILPADTLKRPEAGSRAVAFYYDAASDEFLIYFYIEYCFTYKTEEGVKHLFGQLDSTAQAKINELIKKGQLDNFKNYDAGIYFIRTDASFKVKSIFQKKDESFSSTRFGRYKLFPGTGFYWKGNHFYSQLFDQSTPFMLTDDQRIQQADSLPMMGECKLSFNSLEWGHEILNTKDFPGYSHTATEYGMTPHCYQDFNDTLVVSTEEGWICMNTGKKFPVQPFLNVHENIYGSFDRAGQHYIYCYGTIDSNRFFRKGSFRLRIYNAATAKTEFDMPVACTSFARNDKKIIMIEKDKEHYYIVTYEITEK